MKRIEASWLENAETQRIFEVLTSAGHDVFAVGGCVRNTLLGVPAADIDLATSALPEETTRIAKAAGFKTIPTGYEHGTVTVVLGNTPFEITTFRRDVQTDGRRAVVSFTSDIREDARRRDFTMNALYADASGKIHDPLGGLNDLLSRRVRFIESADDRIKEDYLRSLRFFRFHAQYGDPSEGLDAEALAAISSNLEGLSGLAAERVGAEMLKLLGAADPAPALAGMASTGVLAVILPGSNPEWIAPLVHLEAEATQPPDAIRRLAALGGADPVARLRLSRADARINTRISEMARRGDLLHDVAWRYGDQIAWSVILVRQALVGLPLPSNTASLIQKATAAQFPLRAKDLAEHASGRALGLALKRAEKAWIESNFELTRSALLEIVLKEG